jgi:hypothetical protein
MRARILILLAVIAGATIFATVTLAADADYIGNSQCKVCHNAKADGAQWDVWKSEKHSQAIAGLKTPEADKIAKERGSDKPATETPQCLKCHVTGYNAETATAPPKIKLEDGVQCESCHGPGAAHAKDGQKIKFSKDTTIDVKANLTAITAELCTKCHNTESPNWNPEKYTLPDGTKTGFDFEQAKKVIEHPNPKKQKEG